MAETTTTTTINIPKVTIIFPPGDQLASLLLSKESNTKVEELLNRLCALRAIELDLKKYAVLNDVGEDIDMSKTVGESGLCFIEIVDRKEMKKEKKKVKDTNTVNRGLPNGLKLKIGQCCYAPIEDQLFDDEKKLLAEFKAKYSELTQNFSDEFIMSCLFSRKLNMERSFEFLESNLKWRKDNNFINLPKFSDFDPNIIRVEIHVIGARDKYGRCIKYVHPASVVPNVPPYTIENLKKFHVWYNYVGVFAEGMDALRNGVHGVIDLEGFGWKNFDLDFQKQLAPLLSGIFPTLIRRSDLLNPPLIFNAMIKIFKNFVKGKLMDRLHRCKSEKSLLKTIEKSNLWNVRGGDVEWSELKYKSLLEEWAEKNEDRLSAPGRV